jgi:hypothetical protein
VAAGGLAFYGVMVNHDHSCSVRVGTREGFFYLLQVALVDVSYHAEVLYTTRQGAARNAVRGVATGDHHPGHLQGGVELWGDVPAVSGVLELVSGPAKEAEIAADGPEPAYIMVAGDDDDRSGLSYIIEVGAGADEFRVRAPLGEVTRDRYRVWLKLRDATPQRSQLRRHRGPAKV